MSNPPQSGGPVLSDDDAAPTSKASDDDFKSSEDEKDELPAVGQVWEGAGPTSVFAAFKKSAAPKPAAPPPAKVLPVASADGPVDRSDLPKLMAQFLSATERAYPQIVHFLEGARITHLDDRGMATLAFYKDYEASTQMLDRGGRRENLQSVLTQLLGTPTGIKCEVLEETSPAQPNNARAAPPPPRTAPKVAGESEPQPPQNQGIPVTEELRVEILQKNPLAKSLAEQLGARIVKVE